MSKLNVVVAGAGFAGLETAFLLRHRLHEKVDLTLVSNESDFSFRPNSIYIPFGSDEQDLKIPLVEPTTRQNIRLMQASVQDVDPITKTLYTDGGRLTFDKLIIATGAGMRPQEIPGLDRFGATIWTPKAMRQLGVAIERVISRAQEGKASTMLFLIPPNNKCAGPLYEIVMMTETHLRRKGVRKSVKLVWTTSESSYVQAFGPRLHELVTEEFADRGIEGHVAKVVREVSEASVSFADGDVIPYDELVSFPPYVAAVSYPALPGDDRGFIATEFESRRVRRHEHVYAPGDAGDFPVKQAFLAFLQADAVAEDIAADVLGHERPRVTFDPVSMCVMEQFDKATFAQVPLRLTGDPKRPVEVRPDAGRDYRVGSSPTWRLGKKLLGLYLPMRFRAGEPFHAGAAWQMMDVGLKAMSGVLAH